MSFQPTLRVVVNDISGSIAGTVSTQVVGASVEGLVVTAEPIAGTTLEPFQTEAATAMTDANGGYTIFFLVPGDYEVSDDDDGAGLATTVVTVTVGTAADVTGVDLELTSP